MKLYCTYGNQEERKENRERKNGRETKTESQAIVVNGMFHSTRRTNRIGDSRRIAPIVTEGKKFELFPFIDTFAI